MSLIDLSGVTSSLIKLVQENIQQTLEPGLGVVVTPAAPEKVGSVTNQLSLHMYHVAEDPGWKNLIGPGTDAPNVAKTPMALNLYYILTAHHDNNSPSDALTEQKILGYALKTLHDFPLINDDTMIGASAVLHPTLRGGDNQLQVILRPVSPEDAISYWSAEETRTTRLSAYYEVRVALLEPEAPRTEDGIVLSLGSFPLMLGAPHLDSSMSVFRYMLPATAGGTEQVLDVSPARLAHSPSPASSPRNRLSLIGTNLTGKRQSIFFKNAYWASLSPSVREVEVDLDPAWSVQYEPGRIVVDILSTLDDGGTALTVFPGQYSAYVRVVKDEQILMGQLKQICALSNEVSFTICPLIVSHDPPDAQDRIKVDIDPAFDLADVALDDEVEVVVDGQTYERVAAFTGTLSDDLGKFTVSSGSVVIQPLFTIALGTYPFRLLVNGAESQPFWIEIP